MDKVIYILIVVVIIIYGCVKPYTPATTTTNANVSVVEGIINTGADSTIIKLSRTVIVTSATTANPETKAIITVENAQATVGTLTETVKGTYGVPALNLDNTKQYRIRIKTSNGKTYVSDLVDAKVTPPIDSVGYAINSTGLQVYVNAHDATNNTRYYKYTYDETWQFHAMYQTGYISNGTALSERTPVQQIYYCYGNETSANTVINSTAALTQDVVYQFPITANAATSEKIETKYSIYITQFGLTPEAYTFWENLKKNTEELGSIFDAQPSQLIGNIHNLTDASERVIGYISAGTVQIKRVYITKAQLPPGWQTAYPYACDLDTALISQPSPFKYADVTATLISIPIHGYARSPFTNGYVYTEPDCADCTTRGVITQPSFWK